jgi:hypothetical protein
MYTVKELYTDIKRRSFTDFILNKDIMSYNWTQDRNGVIRRIGLGYRKYQSGFLLYPPNASIRFNKVELILENVLNKYNIKNTFNEFPQFTIKGNIHPVKGVDYEMFDRFISDSEYFSGTKAFDFVFDEAEAIVKYGAMPFFERYQTLENVLKETEKMPMKQMANFIGQPLPQRRMVIKKLCNDPNYNEYVNWLIEYYKSENDPDLFIIEKLNEFLNKEFG